MWTRVGLATSKMPEDTFQSGEPSLLLGCLSASLGCFHWAGGVSVALEKAPHSLLSPLRCLRLLGRLRLPRLTTETAGPRTHPLPSLLDGVAFPSTVCISFLVLF